MPRFKKLLSNIKSRGEAEDGQLRLSGGRLQRKTKYDGQQQDPFDMMCPAGPVLGTSYPPVTVNKSVPFPQTTEELESIEDPDMIDFDAELRASMSRPQNKYIESSVSPYPENIRPTSRYGLTVNTDAVASRGISSSFEGPSQHLRLRSANVRHSASSSFYTVNSQASTVNNTKVFGDVQDPPITPQSSISDDEIGSSLPGSKAEGKKPLLAIRNLDWASLGDEDALNIARAYGTSRSALRLRNYPSTSANDELNALGGKKQNIVQRWLNDQDFSEELQGYLAVEEEERRRVELENELKRSEEEEMARQMEVDRLHAEEVARQEAVAVEARIAAEIAAEMARRKECNVCGELLSPFEFAAKPPTSGCEHPSQTCSECMTSWMASEFETKGCDGIKCPECPSTLEYADVQLAASAETFAAYDKLATRNALGGLEEFSWCLKADCGSGQLNIDNNAFMHCASCGYQQCLTHNVEWHTGETCAQYDYRVSGQKNRDEEKKTEAMLDTLSKKCPNTACGWRIEKISGCDHMKCKRCQFEFCWLCLASHAKIKQEGNTAHAKDCKYHSKNLDVAWPFNAH